MQHAQVTSKNKIEIYIYNSYSNNNIIDKWAKWTNPGPRECGQRMKSARIVYNANERKKHAEDMYKIARIR